MKRFTGASLLAILTTLVLAVLGSAAATASEVEFHSEFEQTDLVGSELEEAHFLFAGFGTYCKSDFATTTHSQEFTELPADLQLSACRGGAGGNEVSMNGCRLTLRATGTVEVGGSECAARPITMRIGAGPEYVAAEIGPQTVNGVTYTNQGAGASQVVSASAKLSGIQFVLSQNGKIVANYSNGIIRGSWLVSGTVNGSLPPYPSGFWVA